MTDQEHIAALIEMNRGCIGDRVAAEKKLSAATALLERCADEMNYDEFDDPAQRALQHDVSAFLARAPGQPAAPTFQHPGAEEVFQRLQEARQPVAPEPATFAQLGAQVFNSRPAAPEPSADRGLSAGGTVDHIGDESERLGFSGANGDRSDEHDQVRDYESGDGAAGGWQVQDPSGSRGDDAENAASRSGWRSSVGTGSAGGAGGLEQEAASKLVLEYGVRWKRRAETAEAKLAAVQEALWYPGATSDQRMLRARAVFILTPAGPNGGAK
jgi:hypothetical protein